MLAEELSWFVSVLPMILIRSGVAILCGGLIGIERERRGKAAGFRTNTLICLGSAIYMFASDLLFLRLGITNTDPTRIAAQIVTVVRVRDYKDLPFVERDMALVTTTGRIPLLLIAGPIFSVIVLSLIGLSTNALTLGAILVIGGLGGAAFHPPAAALVHRVSGHRKAFAMSFHITGGSVGFSMGPLVFAPLVQREAVETRQVFLFRRQRDHREHAGPCRQPRLPAAAAAASCRPVASCRPAASCHLEASCRPAAWEVASAAAAPASVAGRPAAAAGCW